MIVKLVLAYDGTGFRGWARQPRVRTVQGVLEEALGRVLGEPPTLSVAGRTDAGVHARGQVASLAAPDGLDLDRLHRALISMLAPEVVVISAGRAPDGFDARRSATAREYRYRIRLGDVPDPFTARSVWHRPGDLRLTAMRRAAHDLTGKHDFASFGRTPGGPGASTVRRLEKLSIWRSGDDLEIGARANAFLRQMVRSLVGTLIDVGEGRIDPGSMPEVIAAKDRSRAGQVPPPHGLTLERIAYGRALTLPRNRR